MNEPFCDYCGVVASLHPDPGREDDENCDVAIHKAEMLDRFWQPFRRGAGADPTDGPKGE